MSYPFPTIYHLPSIHPIPSPLPSPRLKKSLTLPLIKPIPPPIHNPLQAPPRLRLPSLILHLHTNRPLHFHLSDAEPRLTGRVAASTPVPGFEHAERGAFSGCVVAVFV